MKKIVKQISLITLISGILGIGTKLVHPDSNKITFYKPKVEDKAEVTVLDVMKWDKDTYVWFDARAKKNYDKSHIPGAIHFEVDDLENADKIGEIFPIIESNKKIVTYCSSDKCPLSRLLAKELILRLGKKEVYVLVGGWKAWQEHQANQK